MNYKTIVLSDEAVDFIKKFIDDDKNIKYVSEELYNEILEKARAFVTENTPPKRTVYETDFENLNKRLGFFDDNVPNRQYVKDLALKGAKTLNNDIEDDFLYSELTDKICAELSKNLDKAIDYIDTCSHDELNFVSQVFDDLSAHFKSKKFIDCVMRNAARFDDAELKKYIESEFKYMVGEEK